MIAFITYLARNVEEIKQLLDQYPYLTLLTYGGVEYVGIVQNSDEQITTIYDFSALKTTEQKVKFLELEMFGGGKATELFPSMCF